MIFLLNRSLPIPSNPIKSLHIYKYRLLLAALLTFLVSAKSSVAAAETDFLNWLKQPASLYQLTQPASVTWYTQAPSKDILLRQELQYARRKHDDASVAHIAVKLGFYQLKNSHSNIALDYFLEAFRAAQRTRNNNLIINSGLGVAFIHHCLGAYQKSNEILSQLRSYASQLNDPETNGIVYALMADNYGWLNEISSCTESFRRAAKSFARAGNLHQSAVCHLSLGENQLRLELYDEARLSIQTALELATVPELRAVIFRDAGLVNFKLRKFEKAATDFKRSLEIVPDYLVTKLLKESYMQLFTIYSYQQNFTLADSYHALYLKEKTELETSEASQSTSSRAHVIRILQLKKEQRDSISISGQQLELSRMIDKRDMELQQKESELAVKTSEADSLSALSTQQKLDLTVKQAEIARYQNTRNMLIAFSVITFLLLLLFYNRYSLKKKSGEILARSNNELKITLQQLRDTQDQLIHSEKMAGLGKLTAGIAHEIQNPLNFVRNFSESGVELFNELKALPEGDEKQSLIQELEDTLGRIQHHANRADSIVKSMLQHSRPGGTTLEFSDINSLLQNSIQLAYHSMRATVMNFFCRIEEDLAGIPEVEVIPQQVSRVFLNIAQNAFYAVHEEMQKENLQTESVLKVTTRLNDDMSKVIIEFADNGPGIPPENLPHIFEPFFTSKPTGKGTGLGLSISYDIIHLHGGELMVENAKDGGALFTVILPVKQHQETI